MKKQPVETEKEILIKWTTKLNAHQLWLCNNFTLYPCLNLKKIHITLLIKLEDLKHSHVMQPSNNCYMQLACLHQVLRQIARENNIYVEINRNVVNSSYSLDSESHTGNQIKRKLPSDITMLPVRWSNFSGQDYILYLY